MKIIPSPLEIKNNYNILNRSELNAVIKKKIKSTNYFKNKPLLSLYRAYFYEHRINRMSCKLGSRIHKIYKKINKERGRKRRRSFLLRKNAGGGVFRCPMHMQPLYRARSASSAQLVAVGRRRRRTAGLSVILLRATTPPILRHLYCPYCPPAPTLLLPPFYDDCAPEEARQVSRRRSCSFAPLGS